MARMEKMRGDQYEDTPEEYMGPIQFVNWHGYKLAVYGASKLNTEFFEEISARQTKNEACIIVVTGGAGTGKSYLAGSFARIFDEKFHILDSADPITQTPEKDPSQIVFAREQLLYLIGNDSPLKFGQCIVSDEAQYMMGARRWFEDIQKDLMEQMESVRSKGYIIVIVALHLELLDKIVRKYVLTYMFHIEARGRAVVYRLYTPRFDKDMRKRRLGVIYLPLPNSEQCPHPYCLRCGYLDGEEGKKCLTFRAKYERRKKAFVGGRSARARDKIVGEAIKKRYSDKDYLKILHDSADELVFRKDRIRPGSIIVLIREKLGVEISGSLAGGLREQLEIMYPELDRSGQMGKKTEL